MAWDLNHCVLIGRLTRDPELRYTPNGAAVCNFSIANNASSKEEDVSFFNVVTWNKTAEVVSKYLSKGRPVCIEGTLRQNRWEDASGQKRSTVEIVASRVHFIGSSGANREVDSEMGNMGGNNMPPIQQQQQPVANEDNFSFPTDNDDTIPY